MIDARFVYLERPKQGLRMERAKFKAGYSDTLNHIERELKHLGAREVTVQAGFRQVRQDGWPYSSAKPDHPGVVLQFRQGKDIVTFRALRYHTFEHNMRAIALSMEALRAVDRYGVVEGQQYAGFKQLAAPTTAPSDTREAKLANLAANGATEGERAAAAEALRRVREAR